MLIHAGKRKKCSFTVLIRTSEGLVDSEILVPSNMIKRLSKDYEIHVEASILFLALRKIKKLGIRKAFPESYTQEHT